MGDKSWVVQINEKLKHSEESQLWKKRSIYRVPACVRDLNSKAYKPQVVSFGPYHHGEDQLMPMEEHKQRALLQFLRRCKKPFEDFVKAMEEVAGDLFEAYERLDERWTDRGRFLQLMILDGCFMLERDMLMLENQLPLQVLERLITVESGITVEGGKSKVVP
ncbi:UPF0481 protein [Acorus gramineus]|uniref:UPF0481 protein n=1 Tax=Acorus gramineus TaxID=55184 RepID=A0AAV9B0P6_ACOGR|nr:UPF0481 protein [Acorus gramineus]